VAGKTLRGCHSSAVVVAIHALLWLNEAWGIVKVRHEAILIVQAQWKIVALLKD